MFISASASSVSLNSTSSGQRFGNLSIPQRRIPMANPNLIDFVVRSGAALRVISLAAQLPRLDTGFPMAYFLPE